MTPLDIMLITLRGTLGEEHVLSSPAVLAACGTATFATAQRVVAILRPGDVEEVRACLDAARACAVPLYPVSGGRNWGLGSRVPAVDRCAVLDLGRLDAITAHDEQMGTLTLQPGVTFRQAEDFLAARGGQWFLPAIGGPAQASVIGNLAERGDGVGPTGDRAAHACALQVMLPDGALITTGFGMFDGAVMTTLVREGPGPALDGLFLQSNLGILLGATLFLSPRPQHFGLLAVRTRGPAMLAAVLDRARDLLRDGVVQPGCLTAWNATKLAIRGAANASAALPGRNEGVQDWHVTAALHAASPGIGQALAAHARDTFAGCGAEVALAEEEDYPTLRQDAAAGLGRADDTTASCLYWRKPAIPSHLRPEADHCGLQWLCLTLPLDGTAFADATAMMEEVIQAHGFETVMSAGVRSMRAVQLFVAILYDRNVAGEDMRAQACHDVLLARLAARAIHPHRLGIQSMGHLASASGDYAALIRQIRHTIDPGGLLAPGRYAFDDVPDAGVG